MAGVGRDIKLSTVIEKNKLASSTPFLVTLNVHIKDDNLVTQEYLRLVNNSEDLTIQGQVYTAFPFSIDMEEIEGGVSEVKVNIQDVTRAVQQRMQAYGGGVYSSVVLSVHNADYLNADPDISEEFDIITASAGDYSVTFTLGVRNMLAMKFPPRMYLRDDFPLLGQGNLRY